MRAVLVLDGLLSAQIASVNDVRTDLSSRIDSIENRLDGFDERLPAPEPGGK